MMPINRFGIGLLSLLVLVAISTEIYFVKTLLDTFGEYQDFRAAQCTPVNVTERGLKFCYCNQDVACVSRFPCVVIKVSVQPTDGASAYITDVIRYVSTRFSIGQCSISPCEPLEVANRKIVSDFVNEFGGVERPLPYTCFHNLDRSRPVIVGIPSTTRVTLGIICSAFALVVCIITLLRRS